MSEKVEIEAVPGGRGAYWYRYNVYWHGREIIHLSTNPELEAIRYLCRTGLKGRVAIVDRKTGKTRSYVSTSSAMWTVREDASRGPEFVRYHPFKKWTRR